MVRITELGTIVKSGTADPLNRFQEASSTDQFSDLIGQFGVGFYYAFLVTTTISLYLKEESYDFPEQDTVIRDLIKERSQFINLNIYLWGSSTKTAEGQDEEEIADEEPENKEKEGMKTKTEKVDKTSWDWEPCNESQPIWTWKPDEIKQRECDAIYKPITKDKSLVWDLSKAYHSDRTSEKEKFQRPIVWRLLRATTPYALYKDACNRKRNYVEIWGFNINV